MRDRFIEINFHEKTRTLINQANLIIDEYAAQGFSLTVRQLYYQFVSRNWLKNTKNNYERLASVVDDARKAGWIDWNAIVDRTRYLRYIDNWPEPVAFLADTVNTYAEDVWRDQDYYVEVWIEKDALIGVVENACNALRVPYFACRGYPSSSELYRAAKRLKRKRDQGKWPVVFYLGDHDPSGRHMGVMNAPDLIAMFSRSEDIDIQMIALNRDQIDEYQPPENYAKESDARYNWYVETTGLDVGWELDALQPTVIDKLVRDNVESVLDLSDFEAKLNEEAANRKRIEDVTQHFDDLSAHLPMIKRYLANRTPDIDGQLLRARKS